MNYFYTPKEQDRLLAARESFSGRLLSDAQFDEAVAITSIIEREIRKTGAFKEKLGDYAYAYARTEKMDAVKAETVIRDLFKARTGQSMNDMRKAFAEREEKLPDAKKSMALEYAQAVGTMIREGDKISFARAFAHQAQGLSNELDITDAGAKRLMKEQFAAMDGLDLYEWGKELEGQFYRPQIEAEKEARERSRGQERDGDGPETAQRRQATNGNGGSSRRGYQPRMRP